MTHAEVVVVGGGVIGASVAYHLAREEVPVRLLERGRLASGASGAAAGMLLPVGEAEGKGPLLAWGMRSLAAFPDLVAELRELSGVDPEYEPSGALHVADTDTRAQRLRHKARDLADVGVAWIDADETRRRCPHLRHDVRGALTSPREGHVRSERLALALAGAAETLGACIQQGVGVEGLLREGDRVVGVSTDGGRVGAGVVVLCAGTWASGALGLERALPVRPVRGQILSLEAPSPSVREPTVADDVYLVPRRDRSLWVGATEESVGFDDRVTAEGVAQLLGAAVALAPALEHCPFRTAWSGLRPATPDRLPAIGAVPGYEGLLVATGHYRNGVLLAPITGRLVADAILGRPVPDDAGPFDPARFGA